MICRDLLSNRFMEWRQTLSIVTINFELVMYYFSK